MRATRNKKKLTPAKLLELQRIADCRRGKHLMTSSVSINGGPRKPFCSWCGRSDGAWVATTSR